MPTTGKADGMRRNWKNCSMLTLLYGLKTVEIPKEWPHGSSRRHSRFLLYARLLESVRLIRKESSAPYSSTNERLGIGFVEAMEKIPVGFKYNLVPGKTDEYLGFTHINLGGCQYFYDATCINLDWLENIGYGFDEDQLVPVKMVVEGYEKFNDNIFFTEGNFTFEEMNDMLRKFTEDDPDGNG